MSLGGLTPARTNEAAPMSLGGLTPARTNKCYITSLGADCSPLSLWVCLSTVHQFP